MQNPFSFGARVMIHNRVSNPFLSGALPWNDPPMPCPFGLAPTVPRLVPVLVPAAVTVAALDVYRVAYAQAVAATRASRREKVRRACPN